MRAIGPGLERGEVNRPSEFNIYTREAGAGGLSIAVEGPSKAEIDFQDKKDGSCNVAYTATEPGKDGSYNDNDTINLLTLTLSQIAQAHCLW